jgi:3'-phosphoadenosine 5'-phosphosulfate sulfotransferase (PAPS reductase)/FAD synthetase
MDKQLNFNLLDYDKYIILFSGGKDSISCFLYLLENKVPKDKIELWHQEIDGREESFFDWEITPDYCRKFAEAFGVKIYFQWKEGGFKRELLRKNSLTAPTCFEQEDGTIGQAGGTDGNPATRRKFPQQSPDLGVRWCSAYLKINVFTASFRNQDRFKGIKTLVLSGERGEESPQRAKYAIFEPDPTDLRTGKSFQRHVDRFRPIRDRTERQVWELLEKYRVRAHPCYYMGWGRCSCKFCIFGNKNQFASAAKISPNQIKSLINLEKEFGCTIHRSKSGLESLIQSGTVYENITEEPATLATSYDYNLPVIIPDNEEWILPAGAFGENCGSI